MCILCVARWLVFTNPRSHALLIQLCAYYSYMYILPEIHIVLNYNAYILQEKLVEVFIYSMNN